MAAGEHRAARAGDWEPNWPGEPARRPGEPGRTIDASSSMSTIRVASSTRSGAAVPFFGAVSKAFGHEPTAPQRVLALVMPTQRMGSSVDQPAGLGG